MENEKDIPLPEHDSSTSSPSEDEPKVRTELNVVSVPNDQDMIAQEMADLFEEDQVTHRHGNSEPEGD
ncbi:MAG: hypothetical protein ACPGYT_05560 [Nitrospirales bacterium]